MVMIRNNKRPEEENNNIFWTTIADLMLGLAIIFIAMFILAITGFNQKSVQQQKVKMDVAKQMEKELKKNNIKAEVDKMNGDIKIPSSTLFGVNSYVLKPEGKAFLNKLTPIYVNTIFSNKKLTDNVESIIIQGHTDSQGFEGLKTVNQQFIHNMDLSTKRANAVAAYMLEAKYNQKYNSDFRKKITVEGRSFNDLIRDKNGKEDMAKSRRVEIKLKVHDWNIKQYFGMGS